MTYAYTKASTLYFVSGKIAAGKSTLAVKLAEEQSAVLFSEDDWLASLYPGEINSLEDYVRCSIRLRETLRPHVTQLLKRGIPVVLDYAANTLKQRVWFHEIVDAAQVAHELHYIDVPDEVCKARLRDRNQAGDHPFQASEADYDLITSYFAAPTVEEGFNIILHQG